LKFSFRHYLASAPAPLSYHAAPSFFAPAPAASAGSLGNQLALILAALPPTVAFLDLSDNNLPLPDQLAQPGNNSDAALENIAADEPLSISSWLAQELANSTGIPLADLVAYEAANDGRFQRITQCRNYLINHHGGINPQAAMTLAQVLALPPEEPQQSLNLRTAYFAVLHHLMSIDEAKALLPEEEIAIREGYAAHVGPIAGDPFLVFAQIGMQALEAYRAAHASPSPAP